MVDGQRILSIDEKYDLIITDIKSDIDDDLMVRITPYSIMIESGFVVNNINSIMDTTSDKEIEDYFDKYISQLNAHQLGNVEVIDDTGDSSIGRIIFAIKRKAIFTFLNAQLSNFIKEFKEHLDETNTKK